jgi:hypothetical protein
VRDEELGPAAVRSKGSWSIIQARPVEKETRNGEMPGRMELLDSTQVDQLLLHVLEQVEMSSDRTEARELLLGTSWLCLF